MSDGEKSVPNKIIIDGTAHVMNADYVSGALHQRVGLKTLFKHTGASAWEQGRRNEADRQHLRYGTDVLTEPDTNQTFPEDHEYGATTKTAGRYGWQFVMSHGNYRRDLLIACGAYHAANQLLDEQVSMSPGEMRKSLSQIGIWVSTEDCGLLMRLRYDEARLAEASLNDEDVQRLAGLKDTHRRLLEICADIHHEDWSRSAESDVVSWRARRSPGWSTSTLRKMEAAGFIGENALLRGTGNGWISITPKGILADRHLRERSVSAALAQEGTSQRIQPHS